MRDRGDGDDDDEWRKQRRATTRERRACTRPRVLCFESMVAVSGCMPRLERGTDRTSGENPPQSPPSSSTACQASPSDPRVLEIATTSNRNRQYYSSLYPRSGKRAETRSLSGPDQVLCTTPTAPGHLSLPSLISPTYYHSLSLSFANSLVRQQDSASLAQPRRKREKKEPDLFNAPRTTTTTNLSGYSGFLPSRWRTPQEDKLGGGFTRRHPRPGCWPVRRGRQGKESAQDAIPRETTTTGTHVRVVERSVRAL